MRTDARLAVSADPRCVGAARRLVDDNWAQLRDVADLEAVRLLVSELVTNVIQHTRRAEGELRLELDASTLRVEVEDNGAGVPTVPIAPHRDLGGGFGLQLVERLSDRWGVRARNTVWFEMSLHAPRAARRASPFLSRSDRRPTAGIAASRPLDSPGRVRG